MVVFVGIHLVIIGLILSLVVVIVVVLLVRVLLPSPAPSVLRVWTVDIQCRLLIRYIFCFLEGLVAAWHLIGVHLIRVTLQLILYLFFDLVGLVEFMLLIAWFLEVIHVFWDLSGGVLHRFKFQI